MLKIISNFIYGIVGIVAGVLLLVTGDTMYGILLLVVGAILLYYGYHRSKKRKNTA